MSERRENLGYRKHILEKWEEKVTRWNGERPLLSRDDYGGGDSEATGETASSTIQGAGKGATCMPSFEFVPCSLCVPEFLCSHLEAVSLGGNKGRMRFVAFAKEV